MYQTKLPSNHKTTLDRFVDACQSDARIVAAFLGDSYVTGAADAHSDLDLYLITTDEAYGGVSRRARGLCAQAG